MAKNLMKEVAQLLGVELREKFNTNATEYNPCYLAEKGLYDCDNDLSNDILPYLLTGEFEIQKPILDDVEKRYLESVLRPFKNRIYSVVKMKITDDKAFIKVCVYGEPSINFPYFKKDNMYKGMETNRGYYLKELGLFEEK